MTSTWRDLRLKSLYIAVGAAALVAAPSCISIDGVPVIPIPFVSLWAPGVEITTKDICPWGVYCAENAPETHYHNDTKVKMLQW